MNEYNVNYILSKVIRNIEIVRLDYIDQKIIKELKKYNISPQANALEYSLFNLCKMDKNYIKWYKENVINNHNKTYFYLKFIYLLNYLSCEDKENKIFNEIYDIEKTKRSFIASGLIDGINNTDKSFEIYLSNNTNLEFSRLTNSQKEISDANGYCHHVSELIVNNKTLENLSFCTGKYKDLFGYKHYHTFLVKNGLALDAANNLAINFEKYIDLLNFEIILIKDSNEALEEIKYLDSNDKNFKKSNMVDILKLAVRNENKKRK